MSFLTINCITNSRDTSGKDALLFEGLINSYSALVNEALDNYVPDGKLRRMYVQFQYDCEGIPGAVKKLRITRFSEKHADIQGYVPVSRIAFLAMTEKEKKRLLSSQLLRVVERMTKRLPDAVNDSYKVLLQKLRDVAQSFEGHC